MVKTAMLGAVALVIALGGTCGPVGALRVLERQQHAVDQQRKGRPGPGQRRPFGLQPAIARCRRVTVHPVIALATTNASATTPTTQSPTAR